MKTTTVSAATSSLIAFLSVTPISALMYPTGSCIPPTKIETLPSSTIYPGTFNLKITLNSPICEAHKTPLSLSYNGSFILNKGNPQTFALAGCSKYKSHIIYFGTNSTGWDDTTAKDGKIEGTHGAKNNGKVPYYKWDPDFAVAVSTNVEITGMTGVTTSGGSGDERGARRLLRRGPEHGLEQRAVAEGVEVEEAFDLKVPGCKPNTEVALAFGVGQAKISGAWSDEAAKVTLSGTFGPQGSSDTGKYTLEFKTPKEVEDSKPSGSVTSSESAAVATSTGAEAAKGGAGKVGGVTTWGVGVMMAVFAVMML